jgi:hypothetical protein
MSRAIVLAALMIGLATVSGCIGIGGSTNTPTKGQELVDLKLALDRGAINQGEYDAAKMKVINR